jgi:hypothetical protein
LIFNTDDLTSDIEWSCSQATQLPVREQGQAFGQCLEARAKKIIFNQPRKVCAKIVKCAAREKCFAPGSDVSLLEAQAIPSFTYSGSVHKMCNTLSGCRVPGVVFNVTCYEPNWNADVDAYNKLVLGDKVQEAAFISKASNFFPMKEPDYVPNPGLEKVHLFGTGAAQKAWFLLESTDVNGIAPLNNMPFGSRCLADETHPADGYEPLGYKFWMDRLGECHVCTERVYNYCGCPENDCKDYVYPESCARTDKIPPTSAPFTVGTLKAATFEEISAEQRIDELKGAVQ